MIQEQCVWRLTTETGENYEELQDDTRTSVCIIGGGFTGLSAAIHLAEKGLDVVVLESHTVGHGGSGRSVGLVNAGTWGRPDDIEKLLGPIYGQKLNKALGEAPALVFDLINRHGIDAQATLTGNIYMAHNRNGEADIETRYAQLSRRGAAVEILTGTRCHEYIGSTYVKKALLDRRAGTINPLAYVNGLASVAKSLGAQIHEHSKVNSVEKSDGHWYVRTANASVKADKVIIATNAYTEGEWTEVGKTFFPVSFYQVASEPLHGEVADRILPYKTGAWDSRLALSSFRRDCEGRLILGTVGGPALKPKGFYHAWARRIQRMYYPDLKNFDWQYEWFGNFGFTSDHIFRVLEPSEGIVTASGFNGRGITTGTLMGKCFADYIITNDRSSIPLPFKTLDEAKVSFGQARAGMMELGVTLYHMGQTLQIIE